MERLGIERSTHAVVSVGPVGWGRRVEGKRGAGAAGIEGGRVDLSIAGTLGSSGALLAAIGLLGGDGWREGG